MSTCQWLITFGYWGYIRMWDKKYIAYKELIKRDLKPRKFSSAFFLVLELRPDKRGQVSIHSPFDPWLALCAWTSSGQKGKCPLSSFWSFSEGLWLSPLPSGQKGTSHIISFQRQNFDSKMTFEGDKTHLTSLKSRTTILDEKMT